MRNEPYIKVSLDESYDEEARKEFREPKLSAYVYEDRIEFWGDPGDIEMCCITIDRDMFLKFVRFLVQ